MYGFADPCFKDWIRTLRFTIELEPEFITLYRMRYKKTRIQREGADVELDDVNKEYNIAFEMLNKAGFKANYGKNTFSRIKGNHGTSSYLTRRVIEGASIHGFWLGSAIIVRELPLLQ